MHIERLWAQKQTSNRTNIGNIYVDFPWSYFDSKLNYDILLTFNYKFQDGYPPILLIFSQVSK